MSYQNRRTGEVISDGEYRRRFGVSDDRISELRANADRAQKQTETPPAGRFLSAIPGNLANTLIKNPVRFAASAAVAPVDIARQGYGLATNTPVKPFSGKIPLVGQTFQGEASQNLRRLGSETTPATAGTYASALKPFAEVPLAGAEVLGIPAATRFAKDTSKVAIRGASQFLQNRADKKSIDFALELTSRPITKKAAEEAITQGSGGYKAPSLFGKGTIKPTNQDVQVAEASAPYIKKGASVQQNIDSLKQGVSQINLGVREMIATRKVPFNQAQLRTRLSRAKDDRKLVFATDSSAEKAYDAVIDEYVSFVNKGKKDTLGLFDSRQAFDRYIERKFPNAFKKDATGQFIDPKDNIRYNAILDVRRAANEYIAEQLPKNNPLRNALMRESHMIDAIGRIASKNSQVIGKNQLQLLTDEYPLIKWAVSGLAGAAGIGVGASIIGSTD